MHTGDRIKELRMRRGLSQAALGERVDTDSTTVSRWETGRARPSQKYMAKLANALSTSTDYLLAKTDDPELRGAMPMNIVAGVPVAMRDKRLIIGGKDLYADLPESPEGFEIMRLFIDMMKSKNPGQ